MTLIETFDNEALYFDPLANRYYVKNRITGELIHSFLKKTAKVG